MSDRTLFLSALSLGLIATLPVWARAKGQWCNGDQVLYQADMTLDAATVGGEPSVAPEGLAFRVSTTGSGELDAVVFCPACETSVAVRENLGRKP